MMFGGLGPVSRGLSSSSSREAAVVDADRKAQSRYPGCMFVKRDLTRDGQITADSLTLADLAL